MLKRRFSTRFKYETSLVKHAQMHMYPDLHRVITKRTNERIVTVSGRNPDSVAKVGREVGGERIREGGGGRKREERKRKEVF